MQTPLAEEHRAAGAQLGEFYGCLLPEQFSGLEAEYAAARNVAALIDTNWHATWFVAGRDRV